MNEGNKKLGSEASKKHIAAGGMTNRAETFQAARVRQANIQQHQVVVAVAQLSQRVGHTPDLRHAEHLDVQRGSHFLSEDRVVLHQQQLQSLHGNRNRTWYREISRSSLVC